MRTTVTIDPDTEALLREEVKRTGLSFKQILNESIRRALGRREASTSAEVLPLFDQPFPAEFRDQSFNRLADAWDDEETLGELKK